jgi:hypothetical protein
MNIAAKPSIPTHFSFGSGKRQNAPTKSVKRVSKPYSTVEVAQLVELRILGAPYSVCAKRLKRTPMSCAGVLQNMGKLRYIKEERAKLLDAAMQPPFNLI